MKALTLVIVGFAATLMLARAAQAWPTVKTVITKTYTLDASGSVAVDDVSGDVKITGWDQNRVEVIETKTSWSEDDLPRLQTQVASGSETIGIHAVYPDDCTNCDISYAIQAPRGAHVTIESASGDITVRAMSGPVRADSASGDIEARDISGDEHLHSSSGSLTIANAGSLVQAFSASGDIDASDLAGDVDLVSNSGDVSAAFSGWSGVKSVRAESDSGDIALTVPRGAGFRIQASTASGSIDSDLRLPIQDRDAGADVDAQVGSGAAAVQLRDESGDIKVTMR
jgi:hypothetical protein